MYGWQTLRRRKVHREYLISAILVLAAVLISAPALRSLRATDAMEARDAFTRRLALIKQQARADFRTYTVTIVPASPIMMVNRWEEAPSGGKKTRQYMQALSEPLPGGVLVESSTLPRGELVINESGFTLSQGRIILRARDGSRAVVMIGDL